jgi:predicted nucleotidyltransferase
VAADLGELGARWAVVGALAVSARAEPRFTRDIDLAAAVDDDADAERLVHRLLDRRYRVSTLVEQEGTGRLATVRLVPPGEEGDGVVVDVLFASAGIEPEVVAAADWIEVFPGLTLPVATTAHLVALKVLARDDRTRPQDRADLVALLSAATPADLEQARTALALITARGYHRGKDLQAELDALLTGGPA